MTNEQKIQFLQWLSQIVFHAKQSMTQEQWAQWPKPDNLPITMWNPRGFVNDTMYGIDLDLNLDGKLIQIRCLEQNPNKTLDGKRLTKYAILARRGVKIMWVIDRNGSFLGRIQDGQWHPAQDRAVSPGPPQQTEIHAYHADGRHEVLPPHVQSYEQARAYHNQPQQETTSQATQNQELMIEPVSEWIPDVDIGIPEYVLRHYSEMEAPDE